MINDDGLYWDETKKSTIEIRGKEKESLSWEITENFLSVENFSSGGKKIN